jgi:hypothetical protein
VTYDRELFLVIKYRRNKKPWLVGYNRRGHVLHEMPYPQPVDCHQLWGGRAVEVETEYFRRMMNEALVSRRSGV